MTLLHPGGCKVSVRVSLETRASERSLTSSRNATPTYHTFYYPGRGRYRCSHNRELCIPWEAIGRSEDNWGTARLVVTLRSLKWRARGRLRCPRNYTMDSLNENDNLWQRPGMKQHVHIRCRSILVLFR